MALSKVKQARQLLRLLLSALARSLHLSPEGPGKVFDMLRILHMRSYQVTPVYSDQHGLFRRLASNDWVSCRVNLAGLPALSLLLPAMACDPLPCEPLPLPLRPWESSSHAADAAPSTTDDQAAVPLTCHFNVFAAMASERLSWIRSR